jgi:predicted branched-subunit amino acid permease
MSDPPAAPPPGVSLRAGAIDIAPVLLGMIPFALVFGVASVEAGLGLPEALGFSTLVFAGASQLVAVDLLDGGAPAWVVAMTVIVINLRLAMYSASLGTYWVRQPVGRRAIAAYLLTDQVYAVSVARFEDDAKPSVERWWYYLGAGVVLWTVWQATTVIGVVVGDAVPEGVPLGFAVPLTFLCLLLPAVSGRPALVAALVGGSVAIAAAGLPANLGMPLGALTGVGIGYLVRVRGRRAWR